MTSTREQGDDRLLDAGGAAPARDGSVSEVDDRELAAVMVLLAQGDGAAFFTFRTRYSAPLTRMVRGIASSRHARLTPDQVEELVTEAALAITNVASGWRAGGAPPWIWARLRVAAAVDGYIGQWADELPDAASGGEPAAPMASPGSEPPLLGLVAKLAEENVIVALLQEAVSLVATPRDCLIFFEHGLQVSLGDRSPAATVAGLLGLQPAAVRQQQHRVRSRLRHLAEHDPRFAPLAALPLVALPLVA
ncbi:MAG: hypothetical protein ABIP03_12630 [Aquihabitans sp.]